MLFACRLRGQIDLTPTAKHRKLKQLKFKKKIKDNSGIALCG